MKHLFLQTLLLITILSSVNAQRGRVQIKDGTLVTDRGTLLRGAYVEIHNPQVIMPTKEQVSAIKYLGLNCIHVYGENPYDPACEEPGCLSYKLDSLVNWTANDSLYLILTIGGWTAQDDSVIYTFWKYYAEKYKDETHIIFEICNEPDDVPYDSLTIDMEKRAYDTIRKYAPETHILLLTPWNFFYDSILYDIEKLDNVNWSNASIAGHGYQRPAQDYIEPIQRIKNAGYPLIVTEFHSLLNQYTNLALSRVFEQENVSYLHFIDITKLTVDSSLFKSRIEASEVRWTPDFGTWPESISEINYQSPYKYWPAIFYDEGSGWLNDFQYATIEWISDNEYIGYYNLNFDDEPASFEVLCSSDKGSGAIELHLDSINGPIAGVCYIANTGGWDIYEYFKCNITTPFEGIHNIYLVFKQNGSEYLFNVEGWYFVKSDLVTPQTPFHGLATLLPGKIEAEEYDIGGSIISFLDMDTENQGALFRDDEVDIDNTGDGGYCIAWTAENEWIEYTVSCEQETAMDIQLRGACVVAGDKIRIKLNNQVLTIVNLPNTGGFQNWETVTIEDIRIPAGEDQILRIQLLGGYFNLDWLNFVASETNSIDKVSKHKPITFYPNPANDHIIINTNEKGVVEIYNLHGKLLIQKQLSANDKIIPVNGLPSGSYMVKITCNAEVHSEILIIE